MKALAFPWFVVKVRPLCTRGSLKAVEAGKPDRALMVRHVWARSGLCSRSARNSLFDVPNRKLADLGAWFKVLRAVFRCRPSGVVSPLNGVAELWR